MSNNFKKVLEQQKDINDAVAKIVEYFGQEMPYYLHIEQMVDAQTEILGLLELAKEQNRDKTFPTIEDSSEEIILFLRDVRTYLKLLKPFIELTGQLNLMNNGK